MSLPLILAALWVLAACLVAMLPSKRNHWPAAYVLIALGLPLLGFIGYRHGPWITLLVALAFASILRWPVIYLARWLKSRLGN